MVSMACFGRGRRAAAPALLERRNRRTAFATGHCFNAHYVHDRASALRRFGAPPCKGSGKTRCSIDRTIGARGKLCSRLSSGAKQTVRAVFSRLFHKRHEACFLAGCHPSSRVRVSIRVALNHVTHYRYDRLVSLSPEVVRLRPAPHCRTPFCLIRCGSSRPSTLSTGSRTRSPTIRRGSSFPRKRANSR